MQDQTVVVVGVRVLGVHVDRFLEHAFRGVDVVALLFQERAEVVVSVGARRVERDGPSVELLGLPGHVFKIVQEEREVVVRRDVFGIDGERRAVELLRAIDVLEASLEDRGSFEVGVRVGRVEAVENITRLDAQVAGSVVVGFRREERRLVACGRMDHEAYHGEDRPHVFVDVGFRRPDVVRSVSNCTEAFTTSPVTFTSRFGASSVAFERD
mmetsp:Transcript_17360/g.53398  ORF Transcript_17360/g.53398 Transcript_17360/m.53398 type:complete len:212 (+) Transcript_17360:479-1114(+)